LGFGRQGHEFSTVDWKWRIPEIAPQSTFDLTSTHAKLLDPLVIGPP